MIWKIRCVKNEFCGFRVRVCVHVYAIAHIRVCGDLRLKSGAFLSLLLR